MNRKGLLGAIIGLAVMLFSSSAFSEPGKGGPHGMQGKGKEFREKLRGRIEAMVIKQVTDDMALPAAQEKRLVAVMQEFFDKRFINMMKMHALMKDIRTLEAEGAPSSTLKKKLDALDKLHRDMNHCDDTFMADVRRVLTVEQQAKFIVVWQDAHEKVKTLIDKKRREKPHGGGGKDGGHGGGPGGPPPMYP